MVSAYFGLFALLCVLIGLNNADTPVNKCPGGRSPEDYKQTISVGNCRKQPCRLRKGHTVDVEFKFNGSENQNIPKFKRSVVKNVDVNYAPNGWATHDDGSPVQTTITIDFQEMVPIDKKAIESGY